MFVVRATGKHLLRTRADPGSGALRSWQFQTSPLAK